jgi:putative addiction module killer protein
MFEVRQTQAFRRWLLRLRDPAGKARLVRRIERLASGNAGDCRFLGAGLYELRDHAGPGYRIYYTKRSARLVLLLGGGDKGSQASDIGRARTLLERLEADE